MHNNPFPPRFITARADLLEIFVSTAAGLGIDQQEAEHLYGLLPASVRDAPAVKMILGDDWHYVFGKPFHLDGDSKGFGVPWQAPLVMSLVISTRLATQTLTTQQFYGSWRRQLDNPSKHFDALVEMLAVSCVASDSQLFYEASGAGIGASRIDWLLKTAKDGDFLLEVKNRPGQPARELSRIRAASKTAGRMTDSEPVPDFEALFRSTWEKFIPLPTSCIQGVILFTGLKLPGAALENFFHSRLETYLHFAALGEQNPGSGLSVNLVTISPDISDRVLSAFGWHNNADLVF